MNAFEAMLSGGHPNSLGRTLEVVDAVQADPTRLSDLIDTYSSGDPIVRLRVSNALKRIESACPDWITPHMDRLIAEVAPLDQASTQWTLAQLFQRQQSRLTPHQRELAMELLKNNLDNHRDWIVLNTTMDTLGCWAKVDSDLRDWLRPRLDRLVSDPRKSVSNRARRLQTSLGVR